MQKIELRFVTKYPHKKGLTQKQFQEDMDHWRTMLLPYRSEVVSKFRENYWADLQLPGDSFYKKEN